MGTTRIKVIDLSGEKEQIKTSRKHAEKLTGVAKIKEEKKPKKKIAEEPKEPEAQVAPSDLSSDLSAKTKALVEAKSPEEPSVPSEPSGQTRKTAKPEEPIHHHHLGKKYLVAKTKIEPQKLYPVGEAIDLLYKTSTTKFDPTVEIHLNVTEKNLRGKINLPHRVIPKKVGKTLVFADLPAHSSLRLSESKTGEAGEKIEEVKSVIWGNEKTIDEIAEGKLRPNRDFDKVVSAPKYMPALVKIANILGPAGLMPNPKNGTITEDVTSALKSTNAEGLEYKTDPTAPIIHTKLGKLSYKPEQLQDNLKALIATVGPTKIKKATVSTTMSPGIKVDVNTVSS